MGRRVGGGEAFMPEVEAAPARIAGAPAAAPTASLDALLALQAVDDALMARRKALRRSTQILDTLDELKADLLAGRVSEGRLNLLLALIGQARERNEPALDEALDAIELRARVELAKFGRFTAA
jgi:hypothetical protein